MAWCGMADNSGERSWLTRVASSVTKVVVRHRQPSRRGGRTKAQAKQEGQKLALRDTLSELKFLNSRMWTWDPQETPVSCAELIAPSRVRVTVRIDSTVQSYQRQAKCSTRTALEY